jgi:hypothetical protein
MLIRGRGPKETGLLFTKPSDVIVADLDGRNRDKKAGLKPPNEAVIHGEIYKARANAAAVVQRERSVGPNDKVRVARSKVHCAGIDALPGSRNPNRSLPQLAEYFGERCGAIRRMMLHHDDWNCEIGRQSREHVAQRRDSPCRRSDGDQIVSRHGMLMRRSRTWSLVARLP